MTTIKTAIFYEHITEGAEQRKIDVLTAAKEIKSYGIDYVDIPFDSFNSELKELLKESGLKIAFMHNNFDFAKTGDAFPAFKMVDTAAELKLKDILIVPGFVKGDIDYDTARENIAKALNELCSYAEDKGVEITLEDFDADYAPYHTIEELLWFLERVPKLKISFDTGNFKYSDQDELKALDKMIDKVVYVHCKDRSNKKNDSEGRENIVGETMYPCAVGSGYIKIETVLKRLVDSGYKGDVVIEHFDVADQLKRAKESAEYLNGLIKKLNIQ